MFPGTCLKTAKKNLQDMKINLSDEEIKNMPKNIYKNLVRKKCRENAFEYLTRKRGKKGKNIEYKSFKMSEYLLPNEELSIEQQRYMFEIRNEMTNIKSNFCSEKENIATCVCGKKENMEHIYYCKSLNRKEPDVKYEKINGENLKDIDTLQKDLKKT